MVLSHVEVYRVALTFRASFTNATLARAEIQDDALVQFIIGTDRFYFILKNGTSIPGADRARFSDRRVSVTCR